MPLALPKALALCSHSTPQKFKVFCTAFFQKSCRGQGAEPQKPVHSPNTSAVCSHHTPKKSVCSVLAQHLPKVQSFLHSFFEKKLHIGSQQKKIPQVGGSRAQGIQKKSVQSALTISSVSEAIISSSFVGIRKTLTFEFLVESSTVFG